MKTSLPAFALMLALTAHALSAEDAPLPLHRRIDELIAAHQVGPVAAPADGAEFVRRVYLDLVGRIPTADEARAFLEDESPEKRTALIDRLMASEEGIRHLAIELDLMLMDRRGGRHVKIADWRNWLEQALRENRPLTQVVADMLAADGTDEHGRAASAFYLERNVEPDLLTRDIARKFFGRDLQCAQCHNHPLVDDYYQTDYYGVRAFVGRLSLFQPDRKKPALVAEKADGEATFKSVFTEREGLTGPRLPGGEEVAEAALAPDQLYEVAPAKNVRPVPTYSRQKKLAELVAAGGNGAFDRNMANRLWALLMGRGVIDPVDLHHSENPPVDPELLDLLASSLVSMNYNVQAFLREIALTRAYQRSSILPTRFELDLEAARTEVAALQTRANKLRETASDADTQADQALEKLDATLQQARPLRDELKKFADAIPAAIKPRDEAAAKVREHQKAVAAKQAIVTAVQAAVTATMSASQSLKDDKELQQALTLLNGKATQVQGELTAAQQTLEAAQKTAADAETALTAARQAWQEKATALAGVEQQVREHRAAMVAAREQATRQRTLATHADQRAAYLETLIAWKEQQTQLAQLAEQKAAAEATLTRLKAEVPPLQQRVAAVEKQVTEATAQLAVAQETVKTADGELQHARETAALLAESLANAESARSRLEAADDLDIAVTKLNATIQTWQSAVAEREAAAREATSQQTAAEAAMATAQTGLKEANAALAQARQKVEAQTKTVADLSSQLETTQAAHAATWTTISEAATARFQVAALTGLSPEQLTFSLLTATGQLDRIRDAAAAKYDKDHPRKEGEPLSDEAAATRQAAINAATEVAIDRATATWIKLYGNGAGQSQDEFFATVDQALFMANGGEIRAWLSGGGLPERLAQLEDDTALAGELFLAVLSRRPTESEAMDVTAYLEGRTDDRRAAIEEMAWAMLSSAEFRFRH